jgi:phosphatidylglycerophosphate synthase
MSLPTLDELRAVVQPPEKMQRRNGEHWAGRLYMRRISLRTTRLLVNSPISPNGYTYLMIVAGVLAGPALLIPGIGGAVLAAFFVQLYLLLDCVDGELARWRRQTSIVGVYLDRIGAYFAEAAFLVGLGFRASDLHLDKWAVIGLATALCVILVKSESDLVDVARTRAGGLPAATEGSVVPRASGAAALRSVAQIFKIHRLIVGIESSMLVLLAGILDLFAHHQPFTKIALVILAVIAAAMVVLHFVSIVLSSRLKA